MKNAWGQTIQSIIDVSSSAGNNSPGIGIINPSSRLIPYLLHEFVVIFSINSAPSSTSRSIRHLRVSELHRTILDSYACGSVILISALQPNILHCIILY